MAKKYAHRTKVPVSRSMTEIQGILEGYGANQFIHGIDKELKKCFIQFRIRKIYIKIIISIDTENEQELRERFRALVLVIKAKLVYVASGMSTIEEQFLDDLLLPNNQTVGDFILPQVIQAYKDNEMPKMLELKNG